MGIIATPLGWIMKGIYHLVKNYGIALLLFTFVTRLIVFPMSVKQQKSTAKMGMLAPELEKLKKKYGKNQQKFQEGFGRDNSTSQTSGPRHKCCICGRTELTNPELDFRYCSRCNGNYEYCSDHLFTHTHVK